MPSDLAAAAAQFEQLRTEVDELGGWLDRTDLLDQPAEDLGSLLTALLGDRARLTTLPDLYQLRTALSERQLGDLLSELDDRQVGVDLALLVFEHAWLMSILEAVALADPRVGAFNGAEHRRSVEEFRIGDAEHIETTAERVRGYAQRRLRAFRTNARRKRSSSSTRPVSSAGTSRSVSSFPSHRRY